MHLIYVHYYETALPNLRTSFLIGLGEPQHNKVIVLNLADFDVKSFVVEYKQAKAKKLELDVPTRGFPFIPTTFTRFSSFHETRHSAIVHC